MEQLRSLRRPDSRPPMRVGLLGCGTVGTEVARVLLESSPWSLTRVAVRDPDKQRSVELPRHLVTTDALSIVKDPEIDVIVELIGGVEPALGLIRQAIAEGKEIVTANKAVLAGSGSLLHNAAADRGVSLLYEGAACAGIPVIRTLKAIAPSDRVLSVGGVLNGTTNFVLGQIEAGRSPGEALELARENGFAEADCSSDLDGDDAANKLALLAALAFGTDIRLEDVARCGIRDLSSTEVRDALRDGERVKLLARAERRPDGRIAATVAPVRLRMTDPLARLEGAQNGVVVETELAGSVSLFGEGAGGRPTAAAVLSDLHEIASIRHQEPAPKQLVKGDVSR